MNLPEEARAEIALALLDSLVVTESQSDAEWVEEIEQRARRVLAGESRGAPWGEVRDRIKAGLAR